MGGIALLLAEPGATPDSSRLQAMVAAAPHRGDVVETLIHGRCGLAVSSAADASDAAIGRSGDLAVALVGSLDNAASLAEQLSGLGHPGADAADPLDVPALLAAGFRAWGQDLPARMRGVFAGAVTDGTQVYCFRDHVGYRPFFYRQVGGSLIGASEAKQVVAGAGIPREPDLDVVEQIYYRTLLDQSPSALRGVRRLPKSTGLMVDQRGARLHRYWDPERLLETAGMPRDELQARFETLFEQAVSRALTGADAISLSGGIDSPAIAAFAAPIHFERYGRPLQAISVVFPKYPSVDESRYVIPLAERLGLPLHTYEQETNPLDGLARWTALADTPFPGAAMAQYEEDFRRVRALGLRSILTGEHAEFVFAFQWKTLGHFLSHGRLGPARRELRERRARGQSWVSLARLIGRSLAPDRVMAVRNRLSGGRPATVPEWIDLRMAREEEPVPLRERWRRTQLAGFIGPGVALEAEEICQAVCGVSVRRPWTDIDLWELFLGLPAEQKFPDMRAKGLVRDLLRGRVPDEILDRSDKTVFDEAMLAEIDYATLRAFLTEPAHRIEGVDYALLARRLAREELTPVEYQWARNLAGVHAFLSQWR
jgi:asparagine synthase (glutamine-hydrolysing)